MKEQLGLQLSQVQQQALKRAMVLLDSVKCKYAITDPAGTKYGTLEIKEPQKRIKNSQYTHGERTTYMKQYLKNLNVGDVVEVPRGAYELDMLQSIGHSVAQKMWGMSSATTAIIREKDCVQFLRLQ